MKRFSSKLSVVIVTAAMMFLGITGLVSNASVASTSGPSGEFIFGTPISTSVADLNPLTATNSLATIVVGQLYSDQLAFQWADGSLTPWLASSWSVQDFTNGTQAITFHLNTAAEWVNGTSVVGPITSQDVKFTFQAIKGNSSLDTYGIGSNLTAISTPNNSTVTLYFNSNSSLFLPYVATQTIIPSAWAAYDKGTPGYIGSYTNMGPYGKEMSAGPFILQSIDSEGATLVANTHFWMGTPHVETIFIEEFKSTADSTLSLKSGSIGGELPSLSDYLSLSTAANITNVKQLEPWTFYLWMNDTVNPYSNVHFRRGMTYAINKTQIMTKAEDGLGSWGASNFSFGGLPTVLKADWAPNLTYYGYNRTAAVAEFEKAGYHINPTTALMVNNTTNLPVKITIVEPPISDWEAAGTFIQSDLNAVGIEATLLDVPFSTWGTDVFTNAFQNYTSYFGYVPPFPNPYLQLQMPYDNGGIWNYESYHNSSLSSLFNVTISQSGSSFTTSIDKIQQSIDSQVPLIPIGNANNYYSYNNKLVSGFLPNLTIDSPYNFMNIVSYYTPATSGPVTLYYEVGIGIVLIAVIGGAVGYTMTKRKKKEEK